MINYHLLIHIFLESSISSTIKQEVRKGKKIRVQPTAISRRKQCVKAKRKPKILREHNYANVHQKAPHNLSQCVYNNTALGQ